MLDTYQAKLAAYQQAILSYLPSDAPEAEREFVSGFFAKSPLGELEKLTARDACALARSAYGFAASREPGIPKIRVFSPNASEHGWESHRVAIELLNDDMPFLVDSLSMELARQGFIIYETLHPIFEMERDAKGTLKAVGKGGRKESFIHFQVSGLPEGMDAQQVVQSLEAVLASVRMAVGDWASLLERTRALGQALVHASAHFPPEDIHEAQDFLEWLIDRNFIFLGHAAIRYAEGGGAANVLTDSLLGTARREEITPSIRSSAQLIEIRKSDRKSQVHRPVLMDVIIVKSLSAKGEVVGEHRLYGLFTSSVYHQSVTEIPYVRRKAARALEKAGFDPASHDGKAFQSILEFLPRDEMFQMTDGELLELGLGVLSLESRAGVRLFTRRDVSGRFVSCMVFVPREYFSTELRRRISRILENAFEGTLENFYTQITDSPVARLQLILRTAPDSQAAVDVAKVEADIASATTLWSDHLRASLNARLGEARAERLIRAYGNAFPQAYISRYDISSTVHDIGKIEAALEEGKLAVEFFRNKEEDERFLHLKIYNPYEEIALSDILPTLEHMGLRAIEEHPFLITPQNGPKVWIRDVRLSPVGEPLAIEPVKAIFEDALLRIWNREVEDDRANALILRAGLNYRQVQMLRAYAKYLKQIGFTFAPTVISQALSAYPEIARTLVALFEARFDPAAEGREERQATLQDALTPLMAQVASLSDDRIFRTLADTIRATLRTNYYQRSEDGQPRPVLSFKFDSHAVPDLPLPKPYAEIFVYSARVEGIHLRGGKVARGGLRWSDRLEDYRTEVLGLMKAQMVKNSVIVPVGSKGGFVLKQLAAGAAREKVQEEGVACYTLYLQGLLDITDNIVNGAVAPPTHVVRHDGDDPYLVVAADKGTATFSDTANGVSQAYGFWLGDAFASGGSAGYDHKKMGITARGAWVSVERHFREMGRDIGQEPFTVCGIGDMAGDVFGNGMLLSKNIRLVAAFNHLHIFLDPNPDAAASFAERERLFNLPRSTWKDYNPALISQGGGVFERSAKRIEVSAEAAASLGIQQGGISPDELIRAILKAPVDLLWNGGIGTYVKAEDETHDQVGDRANNAVRVGGRELRCKLVGEGGNLGFTQKGRIEYARAGGRINTDAIDNSAGVDCSDHEVNIKIAMSAALASGKLTVESRNRILAGMTEDVAALVLKDNQLQTLAISIAQAQGAALLESQGRLMQALERQGLLDRTIEFLPSEKTLAEMKLTGKGFTRPEIAVLLSYAKLSLYRELIESGLPDEPYFAHDLARYFPKAMQRDFAEEINAHPLRREIIATVMTNSIVNRAGITFYHDLAENTGLSAREIAAAYAVARDTLRLRELWNAIEAESATISAEGQALMHASVDALLERATLWLLRHKSHPLQPEALAAEFAPAIAEFASQAGTMHSDATRKAYDRHFAALLAHKAPEALASRIAGLELLASAPDIITVAAGQDSVPMAVVGQVYFDLGARLKLGWLRHYAGKIRTQSHWERMAVQSLIHDLYDEQSRLTALVVSTLCQDDTCSTGVDNWSTAHAEEIQRFHLFLDDLKARDTFDIAVLLVALRHIKMLGS